MRWTTRLIQVLCVFLSLSVCGCVGFASIKVENIPREDRHLRAEVSPSIDVVVESSITGRTTQSSTDIDKHTKSLFSQLASESPFLANAAEDHPDADYRLVIHSQVEQKSWGSPELCGLSFTIVPYYLKTKSHLRVTLESVAGDVMYDHEGLIKQTIVIQFYLAWVSPITLVSLPGLIGPEKKLLRRLLALVERDLARESTLAKPDDQLGQRIRPSFWTAPVLTPSTEISDRKLRKRRPTR